MNFQYDDLRRLLKDSLMRYFRESYTLKDRLAAGQSLLGFSPKRWDDLRELGMLTALFKEQAGGIGGSGVDLMAVFEVVGASLVVEPLLSAAMIAPLFEDNAGCCAAIMAGERFVVPAYDELGNRDEPELIATSAIQWHGGWLLNGQKALVPYACSATHAVVSARTSGSPSDPVGLTLFCVPLPSDGCSIESTTLVDGGAAGFLSMNNVAVSSASVVGAIGEGLELIERSRAAGIVALSAEALGIMEFLTASTLEHLRTRQQFGRPLGRLQALQHRLTSCFIEVEQTRSAVMNAAAELEAAAPARERAVSAAKYTVGRAGTLIAEEAIQLHGGMGMTWESPVAHYAKRLIMLGHQLGDEDYHLARFAALTAVSACPPMDSADPENLALRA